MVTDFQGNPINVNDKVIFAVFNTYTQSIELLSGQVVEIGNFDSGKSIAILGENNHEYWLYAYTWHDLKTKQIKVNNEQN